VENRQGVVRKGLVLDQAVAIAAHAADAPSQNV
jgi:hypothetical protein